MQWPEILPGWHHLHLHQPEAGPILKRLLEMHRRAFRHARDRHSESLSLNALEEVLLWADAAHQSARQPVDGQTRRVVNFLSEHHDRQLTLERLAQMSGQSVARLTREFRRHTGTSVQVYLEDFRLNRARQLLARTTLSVKEISAQTGFQSPYYFSQRFKRKTGKSPRSYRIWMVNRLPTKRNQNSDE
jgi:AraC family transcriptional regulator of arabinose operon